MRYSIEQRDRIYVKEYGFLSFTKNMGKSLSNKHGRKLLNSAKKSTTDAIKTASKRAIQKQLLIWLIVKLLIKKQVLQRKNLQKNYQMVKQKKSM